MQNSDCHDNKKEKLKKNLIVKIKNNMAQMILGWLFAKIAQMYIRYIEKNLATTRGWGNLKKKPTKATIARGLG